MSLNTTSINELLMMSIQNLGSKERVQVKFKDSICTKLCLKLWIESNCPEKKLQIITS